MELRQVEYAVAVVDHGGFTRAAAAMHVAQPSLSQAVRRLEADLGAALFLRAAGQVQLTAAGRAFMGPARRMLRDAENARAAVSDHAAVATGTLDVAAAPTLVVDPLAAMIGRFRARHPAVRVRVAEPAIPARLVDMVSDGRCEVGITIAGPVPSGVVSRVVGRHEMLAVLPPGSRPRNTVSIAALVDEPLVLGPPGSSAREMVEDAFAAAGANSTIAVETGQREAILPLVLAGAGSTVLPRPLADQAASHGAVVARLVPRLTRPVALIYRADGLSPAARAFLDREISGGAGARD